MCSTCEQCPSNLSSQAGSECRKCGSTPFIVIDKVHLECKACFLETCHKRFRTTIGRSKLLKGSHFRIMLAYSGGSSSGSLLNLVKNLMLSDRLQKYRPAILHVDCNFTMNPEERLTKLQSFLQETHALYTEWPLFWTTLETYSILNSNCDSNVIYREYGSDGSDYDSLLTNHSAIDSLTTAIKDLDSTDKLKYIHDSTARLIDQTTAAISGPSDVDKFQFIFTGETSTRLANNLLVDVILGQGSNIFSTVSVCDKRSTVLVFRPLREFSKKEVAFYLRAQGLACSTKVNLATLSDRKSSIQRLTEAFLSKLYVDYPSTYSTLLRTGNKMQN